MRVALFTIWHVGNYGAELQTYCLTKILQGFGHSVEVVDIRLNTPNSSNTNVAKKLLWSIIRNLSIRNLKNAYFWNKNIPSTRKYLSPDDIKQHPPKADVYLVGSDQVWNPEITGKFSNVFFLDIGDKTTIRSSYASSFGVSEWNGSIEQIETIRNLLKRFKYVSCREQTGVNILDKTFGIKGENVLDPTLLLKNYDNIVGRIETKKTLAYYPLSPNVDTREFCNALAKEIGLKVRQANWTKRIPGGIVWNKASVGQWLGILGSATFVVTPSFHGLTVCLTMHRQFLIMITEPLIAKRSSRIKDLLHLLELDDRFFTSLEDAYKSRIWEKPIDYTIIDNKLVELRNKSLLYLKKIFDV